MKWLFFLLLVINAVLAAYVYVDHKRPNPDANIPDFQMNADQIRIIAEPPEALLRPAAQARPACLEWGSFGALELRRVLAALSPLAFGERVAQRSSEVTVNWWVYLPPQRSRAGMQRKAAELVELGVTDFDTVSERGRWQYAISLGLFRTEKGAREYLAELKSKGVRSSEVGKREQQADQTTLIIRSPSAAESAQLVELAMRFPGAEMRATDCAA